MKRFDYCTIVGKNPEIFKLHAENVIANAGLSRDLWNFHVIVYYNSKIASNTTDKILEICEQLDITPHLHKEIEHEGGGDPYNTFLVNLYNCWNMCHLVGDTSLSVRAGSDQAFGANAFKNMLEAWDNYQSANNDENVIMFHNLIECKSNVSQSRHILEDFGRNWFEFNSVAFQDWCDKNERRGVFGHQEANMFWGAPRDLPGLASNGRSDGASWLQSKALFKKFGPMPVYYPQGYTGDLGIMELMRSYCVKFYIIGDSTTYHFSRSGG